MNINVAKVVEIPKLYASPQTIAQAFDISPCTASRLINGMRNHIAFREYVITAHRLTRVRIDAFERYLKLEKG